jgi:probable blue pigment (indigoidine) exporter
LSTSAEPRRALLLDSARLQGLGFLLLTSLSWGLNWPVAKFLLSELPPFSMRALCCALAMVFAFAIAIVRGDRLSVPLAQWPRLFIFSTFNFWGFTIFTTLSLAWLRASEAVIVTYTLPIWAAMIAWPLLGDRPTLLAILALVLGMSGVALLVGIDPSDAGWGKLPGVAMGLVSAVLFALGTVMGKKRPFTVPLVPAIAWQLAISLLPIGALALTERRDWSLVTPLGWIAVLFVSAFPMAYVTWFRALRLLPAATAATGVLISPVVGVIASALLLGDPLGPRQVAALGLTLTGVGLAALRPGARQADASHSPPSRPIQ